MSIRARFFATLRRHSSRALLCLGVCWSALAGTAAGCVVTDKISFEDAVNHPMALLDVVPSEPIRTLADDGDQTFSVFVWDPDVTDPNSRNIEGRIVLRPDIGTAGRSNLCSTVPRYDELEYDVDGPVFEVRCSINPEELIHDSLMSVQVTVSDLGFRPDSSAPEEANQIVVSWVLRVVLQ